MLVGLTSAEGWYAVRPKLLDSQEIISREKMSINWVEQITPHLLSPREIGRRLPMGIFWPPGFKSRCFLISCKQIT